MKEENYDALSRLEENNWWYLGKRQLFSRILQRLGRKFDSALDMGCGVGSNISVLEKFSKKVVGIDYSEKAISYCRKKSHKNVFVMDATKIQFGNASFDLVLCSDILEHLDDKKVIGEISRVMKKGGVFIFSVPAHKYLWGPTDVISNHLRRYEKKEVRSLLKEFDILKLGYWNFFMYLPNLLFLNILRLFGRNNQAKNSLEFIPKHLNKTFSAILSVENALFSQISFPQGVSIIGICRKK